MSRSSGKRVQETPIVATHASKKVKSEVASLAQHLLVLEDSMPWEMVKPSWGYKQKAWREQLEHPALLEVGDVRKAIESLQKVVRPAKVSSWFSPTPSEWKRLLSEADTFGALEPVVQCLADAVVNVDEAPTWLGPGAEGVHVKLESEVAVKPESPSAAGTAAHTASDGAAASSGAAEEAEEEEVKVDVVKMEDDAEVEAEAASDEDVGPSVPASAHRQAQEAESSRANLQLSEVARIKEVKAAFKAFLESSDAATLGEIDQEVKGKIKTEEELSMLRHTQFRAYKALLKLKALVQGAEPVADANEIVMEPYWGKFQSLFEKFVVPKPWTKWLAPLDDAELDEMTLGAPFGSGTIKRDCYVCARPKPIGAFADQLRQVQESSSYNPPEESSIMVCDGCIRDGWSAGPPVTRCRECYSYECGQVLVVSRASSGAGSVRACGTCLDKVRPSIGTCAECKTRSNKLKAHVGRLLHPLDTVQKGSREWVCSACYEKEEGPRKDRLANKYNAIGHLLNSSAVRALVKSLHNVQLNESADGLYESDSGKRNCNWLSVWLSFEPQLKSRPDGALTPLQVRAQGTLYDKTQYWKGAWRNLEAFLEEQLQASFAAFKRSEAWDDVSHSVAKLGSATKDAASVLDDPSALASSSGASGSELPSASEAQVEQAASASEAFADYVPSKLSYGPPHVEHVVESASLACVSPMDVTFSLSLPESAKSSGVLSRVQLEAVVYALQQHERTLPTGCRAGFFIGDGTGVGKGRELAAIVWNNWLRKPHESARRSVWFTCNSDLAVDARRDLNDIGARGVPLKLLTDFGYGSIADDYDFEEGVLLVTYSSLVAKSGSSSRFDQLVQWLIGDGTRAEYQGVLAFDEAHKAKGAAHDQPVGRAVVRLQDALPSARVVYLSATGATKVQDMSYMSRLGLWGQGTYFQNFNAIAAALGDAAQDGGGGAMEMLAVQLKSSGAYLARSLGLRGVDFHLTQAKLATEQETLYNACAKGWRRILAGLKKINEENPAVVPVSFEGAFTAAQTRFFQQLVLSFKVPEIKRQVRLALRAGKCAVIGLQSTGEAAVTSALARDAATAAAATNGGASSSSNAGADSQGKIYSLVSAAREAAEGLMATLSPKYRAQSVSAHSAFVLLQDKVFEELDALKLPPCALDELIEYFGAEHVAEMTGRSKRLIRNPVGEAGYKYISRSERGVALKQVNLRERARFQRGEKLIAILSDAGATGVSLHADKTDTNQRRRVHIVPELGWSASKVVQQFGRTHRTNQLLPPEYVLLTCECAGESLTGSAVARKLEGLGALTKGDKSAGRGETGGVGTNLEGKVGEEALKRLLHSRNTITTPGAVAGTDKVTYDFSGVRLNVSENNLIVRCNHVKQFLSSLQLLRLSVQTKLLRAFMKKIKQTDNAMASQLESTSVRVVSESTIFQNPQNAAEKVTVTEIECNHACAWEKAKELYEEGLARGDGFCGFWVPKDTPPHLYSETIFLAVPIDAQRVRLCFPYKMFSSIIWRQYLFEHCRTFHTATNTAHAAFVEKTWRQGLNNSIKRERHLEKFALLNGSVFSIWMSVRKAMDPRFDAERPDLETNPKRFQFQPQVRIQLVTTSDGQKHGGIRMKVERPLVHRPQPWHVQCNKQRRLVTTRSGYVPIQAAFHTFCRKRACMIESLNEVDKLKKALEYFARELN